VRNKGVGIRTYGTVRNCTVIGNEGFGLDGGDVYNSISYYNEPKDLYDTSPLFSCFFTGYGGTAGCITNAPIFVDSENGDYRLQSNSPCLNAGINGYASTQTDLDKNARIVNGTVDIGAYEYQGAASVADDDNDGLSNLHELSIGTNPNEPDSDLDGFDDLSEVKNGQNPTNPDTWQASYITDHPESFSLYPSNVVLDISIGQMLVSIIDNEARLSLHLQTSEDLQTWTNAGHTSEWAIPIKTNKQFFRVRSEP
jgi:hypothetical protein